RAVAVALDAGAEGPELRLDRGAVVVVEAAARMLEPEPDDDLEAEPLGFRKHRSGILAIGAHGVGAERLERVEPFGAGGPAHDEWVAVDENPRAVDGDVGGG